MQAAPSIDAQFRQEILRDNPVGYWPLDNTAFAQDFRPTASPIPGVFGGTTYPAACLNGSVATGFGSSGYVGLGAPAALDITGPITVSAWIMPLTLPTVGNFGVIFEKGYDGTNEQYTLRLGKTSADVCLNWETYNGSEHGIVSSSGRVFTADDLNRWCHVGGTFDGAKWVEYYNGQIVASAATSQGPVHASANASIGAAYITGTPSRFFGGPIAHAAVYNYALSPTRFAAHYNAAMGRNAWRRPWIGNAGGIAYSQTINDAGGITDSMGRVVSFSRAVNDAQGQTDTIGHAAAFNRILAQAMGITDSASAARAMLRVFSDTSGITDTQVRLAAFARVISDAGGITDANSIVLAILRSISDPVGLTDSTARALAMARTLSDSQALSDTVSHAAHLLRAINDNAGLSDALTRTVAFLRTISDSQNLTDQALHSSGALAAAALLLLLGEGNYR